MRYDEWEPLYLEILRDFGFSRNEDERAARLLAELAAGKPLCLEECLGEAIAPQVTVCGCGPNLEIELSKVRPHGTILAADGATGILMERGIRPDIIVTDLDGEIAAQQLANQEGAIAVLHAHGDNMDRMRVAVPGFTGRVALTTQSVPFGPIRDYGGFTDGDRAVELARHFGAISILLLGFDFEHPRVKPKSDVSIKRRKLRWAERLIFERNPPQVYLSIP
jgi:2-amino-4-hydroxy-6-hydroxymethyldihydropteridine diphosphokinase